MRTPCLVVALFALALVAPVEACGASEPCAAGQSSCACLGDATCTEGLVCDESGWICRAPRSLQLPPIDAAARSCEILLEDETAVVVAARFDASTRGEHVREAPRTAIAFHAMSDAPIGRGAVRVDVLGDGDFRIVGCRCFDRLGEPIADGGIATDD